MISWRSLHDCVIFYSKKNINYTGINGGKKNNRLERTEGRVGVTGEIESRKASDYHKPYAIIRYKILYCINEHSSSRHTYKCDYWFDDDLHDEEMRQYRTPKYDKNVLMWNTIPSQVTIIIIRRTWFGTLRHNIIMDDSGASFGGPTWFVLSVWRLNHSNQICGKWAITASGVANGGLKSNRQ